MPLLPLLQRPRSLSVRCGWGLLLLVGLMWGGAWLRATERRVNMDIPAGSMESALAAFSRLTAVEILYQVEDLQGVRTKGVRGMMVPDYALAALLQGSGLE